MICFEAPAKVNLSLLVHPPGPSGLHPLESLVQTLQLVDLIEFHQADEDSFQSRGALIDPDDNLIVRSLGAMRAHGEVPPVRVVLLKRIPLESGLGGGSSDAAATLLAAAELGRLDESLPGRLAPGLGADVSLFLSGGTQMMRGHGEQLEPMAPLRGFAIAVVTPEFGLETAAVYRRWDEMEGPEGEALPGDALPPGLRGGMPIRNDLLPAALDLEPRLGDFIHDIRASWGVPVAMTGSGTACFGFFGDSDEAGEAAGAVAGATRGFGLDLRPRGVARVEASE